MKLINELNRFRFRRSQNGMQTIFMCRHHHHCHLTRRSRTTLQHPNPNTLWIEQRRQNDWSHIFAIRSRCWWRQLRCHTTGNTVHNLATSHIHANSRMRFTRLCARCQLVQCVVVTTSAHLHHNEWAFALFARLMFIEVRCHRDIMTIRPQKPTASQFPTNGFHESSNHS